jgi:peptide/nickel transport system permease protein
MAKFVARRIGIAAIQILVVTTIVFVLLHMMPGDPVLTMLGSDVNHDPAVVEAIREELGLNDSIPTQYFNWIKGVATGNMGKSYSEKIPVIEAISSRIPRTLELAFFALLLACIVGIPLGVISAIKRGSILDTLLTMVASLGISTPVYVLGYLLVMVFALDVFKLGLPKMPASGYVDIGRNAAEHYKRLILPTVTLSMGLAVSIIRMTRSSMLESMSGDYVIALRAKGVRKRNILVKHILRNSLIPVITVIGLQAGTLIGGTVLVENVFNWPGLSTLLVKAINYRDYPLIQGCIFVMAAMAILTNLSVDLIYGVLDPRAR